MERNDLQEKIENKVIYKVYSANVPIAVYGEQKEFVDTFCRENFMDNRWSMIYNLVVDATEDYKYKMLFDRIMELEEKISQMTISPVKEVVPNKLKTFGRKE